MRCKTAPIIAEWTHPNAVRVERIVVSTASRDSIDGATANNQRDQKLWCRCRQYLEGVLVADVEMMIFGTSGGNTNAHTFIPETVFLGVRADRITLSYRSASAEQYTGYSVRLDDARAWVEYYD